MKALRSLANLLLTHVWVTRVESTGGSSPSALEVAGVLPSTSVGAAQHSGEQPEVAESALHHVGKALDF